MTTAGIVIVFDFDRTIIDDDSDRWVVQQMGLTHFFNQLRPTQSSWTSLMDMMLVELHSQGKTVEDVAECLKHMTLHPKIIAAIKSAHDLGCDLKVLSDANMFYIETILKHHGVYGCFSEIISNPTSEDIKGKLRILPYHDLPLSPHTCELCPANLCKGLVMERVRESTSNIEKKIFIYLGDGGGDFCPSLKLLEEDHVMPRKNFPLWKRICENPSLVKAKVHEWSNGEELHEVLLQLVNEISTLDRRITVS